MNEFIPQLDAKTIKHMVDPYSFYLTEQGLLSFKHRSGDWATAGICPFHEDRKEGSFKVNLATGSFKCWSCGAHGGDVITFVQKRDDLSFKQALLKLAEMWGVL